MNQKKTVLVISDGHEQFDLAATLLRNEGYRVRFGSDTNDSLESAEPLDLIISELAVPNVDGLQLCRRVREDHSLSSTPVLLVGDLSKQSSIVEDSFRCGAADYVQKPINVFRLVDKCRTILAPSAKIAPDHPRDDPFTSLTRNISDFITVIDPADGTIVFEGPSTKSVLGYRPSELVGRQIFDLVHPSDLSEVREYLSCVTWDGGMSPPVEHRLRHKDRSWKLVETKARPINDPQFGAAIAVTSREKAETGFSFSNILENSVLRAAIFDRVPMGIALFSSSGHLIESNPALLEMLDHSEDELRDMSLSEFIFAHDDENDRRALVELFSGKRSHYQFENGYLSPTGERIWGRLTLVMMPGDYDVPQFLIGIFEDPAAEGIAHAPGTGRALSDPNEATKILDFDRWRVNRRLICEN